MAEKLPVPSSGTSSEEEMRTTSKELGQTQHQDIAASINSSREKVDPAVNNETAAPEPSNDPEKQQVQDDVAGSEPLLPPVDRGVAAWTTVLGAFCGLFVTFGWITAIGVFQQAYQTSVLSSYSPSEVAWIVSLEAFMMYFNGPWVGLLFDNHGPRPLILAGTVLHVAGILGASFGSQYWHFILCQGIISPIGAAAIFYPCISCVVTWFDKHRGLALGIQASGASLGGVIFPIMVQSLIPKVGFGWAMRAAALMIIVLLIVTNFTIRPRLPPTPRPFRPLEFVRPLSEPKFFTLCAGAFLVYFGFFIPYDFLPVQSVATGVGISLSQYMIPIMNGASVIGRITPAWLSDRVGRYNVNFFMTGLCSVLTLGLWLPARGAAPLVVYAAGYGFVSGAFVAVLPALIAVVSPDLGAIGARTGTLFATISVGTLAGNPIAGALLGPHRDQYDKLIIFSGVLLGVGTLVLGALRMWLCKGALWAKI